MRVIKKHVAYLMALALCLCMMTMPVFAAPTIQDGLEVSLTTDKEEYSQDEEIIATLAVTNKNEYPLINVELESFVPEGYQLANNNENKKQINVLGAGETETVTVALVPDVVDEETAAEETTTEVASENTPQTDINNNSGNNSSTSSSSNNKSNSSQNSVVTSSQSNTVVEVESNSNIVTTEVTQILDEMSALESSVPMSEVSVTETKKNTKVTVESVEEETDIEEAETVETEVEEETVTTVENTEESELIEEQEEQTTVINDELSASAESVSVEENSQGILWIILIVVLVFIVVSVISIVVFKKKQGKNLLSILLCLSIIGGSLYIVEPSYAAESTSKTVHVTKTVLAGNKEVTLNGTVAYQTDDTTYTRAEWIKLLVDAYGYPMVEDITEYSYTDVPEEYKSYVETAVSYGLLIPADEGDIFEPEVLATREFAAVTAVRSMGYHLTEEIQCTDYSEITYTKEAFMAVSTGLMTLESNKFYPDRALNKTEADIILNVVEETFNTADIPGGSNNGFTFREGVITLDENVEHSDDGSVLRLPLTEQLRDLQEGTMITIGLSSAYKVISSKVEGEYVAIEYSKPELYEFLESIDVEGEAYMDFSRFVPAEGVNVSYNSEQYGIMPLGFADEWFDIPEQSVNIPGEINLSGEVDLGNNWSLSYSLAQAMPSVGYKFDIDFDNGVNIKNAYVKVQESTKVEASVQKDLDGSQHGKVLFDDMCYKYIELGTVPLVGVNGIGVVVEIDLVANVQGSFDLKYNVAGTLGCQIINNQLRNISALQGSWSAGAALELKIGPRIGLLAEVFEEDLLSFTADAGVRVGASINNRSTGLMCLDAGVTLYAELNALENSLIDKWLDISYKFEIWDEYSSPLKLKFHYEKWQNEDWEKVNTCSYEEGGTIKGMVADATNRTTPIAGANIAIFNTENMGLIKTATADTNGQYRVTVEGGTYKIRVSADGYIPLDSYETVMDNQQIYVETYLMVAGDENTTETGRIGGYIKNAVTGEVVPWATIKIRKGWNNTTGDIVATTTTDIYGFYNADLVLGNYTVVMERAGYVSNHFNIAVVQGTHFDKHGTMNPDAGNSGIPTGDMRIVLEWGETPWDLDSHLYGPTPDGEGTYHTCYWDKSYYYDGTLFAFLDVDDVTSYGPETTTVYSMGQTGTYSFYVHDYTNRFNYESTAMSNSGAKITVYIGEEIVAVYNVPTLEEGTVWHVFDFDADTRELLPVNTFSNDLGPISTYARRAQMTPLKEYELEEEVMEETETQTVEEEVTEETETQTVEEEATEEAETQTVEEEVTEETETQTVEEEATEETETQTVEEEATEETETQTVEEEATEEAETQTVEEEATEETETQTMEEEATEVA